MTIFYSKKYHTASTIRNIECVNFTNRKWIVFFFSNQEIEIQMNTRRCVLAFIYFSITTALYHKYHIIQNSVDVPSFCSLYSYLNYSGRTLQKPSKTQFNFLSARNLSKKLNDSIKNLKSLFKWMNEYLLNKLHFKIHTRDGTIF